MACDLAGPGADYSAMAYLTCPAWTENGLIGRKTFAGWVPDQAKSWPWGPYDARLAAFPSSRLARRYAEGVTPMRALNAAVNFDGLP